MADASAASTSTEQSEGTLPARLEALEAKLAWQSDMIASQQREIAALHEKQSNNNARQSVQGQQIKHLINLGHWIVKKMQASQTEHTETLGTLKRKADELHEETLSLKRQPSESPTQGQDTKSAVPVAAAGSVPTQQIADAAGTVQEALVPDDQAQSPSPRSAVAWPCHAPGPQVVLPIVVAQPLTATGTASPSAIATE